MRRILIAIILAAITGGLIGREIVVARNNRQRIADLQIRFDRLSVKTAEMVAMVKRGNAVSAELEKGFSEIRQFNSAIDGAIRREVEKAVYAQCIVPDSGVTLLNRHIEQGRAFLKTDKSK